MTETELRKDIKAGPVIKALMLPSESLTDGMAQWKRLSIEERNDLLECGLREGITVPA